MFQRLPCVAQDVLSFRSQLHDHVSKCVYFKVFTYCGARAERRFRSSLVKCLELPRIFVEFDYDEGQKLISNRIFNVLFIFIFICVGYNVTKFNDSNSKYFVNSSGSRDPLWSSSLHACCELPRIQPELRLYPICCHMLFHFCNKSQRLSSIWS